MSRTSICRPVSDFSCCVRPTRNRSSTHNPDEYHKNDRRKQIPSSCCWGSRTNSWVLSLLPLCHSASGKLLRSQLTWNLIRKVWWAFDHLLVAIKSPPWRIQGERRERTDAVNSLFVVNAVTQPLNYGRCVYMAHKPEGWTTLTYSGLALGGQGEAGLTKLWLPPMKFKGTMTVNETLVFSCLQKTSCY